VTVNDWPYRSPARTSIDVVSRTDGRAAGLDHRPRGWIGDVGDERDARLRDPDLVAGDLGRRVAEDLRMVERDVGDNRDERVEHVGPIELAANADLDDGEIDLFLGEIHERDRQQRLVVRGATVGTGDDLDRRHQLAEDIGEAVRRDRQPVDPRPLGHRREMRLHVQPGLLPGGLHDRGDHRRRRTLPAGPADVDRHVPLVRVADRRQECPHPIEPIRQPPRRGFVDRPQ
jgi:hypothetical protein